MNPDIKRRWIDALRSGNFQQGKSVLRTPDDHYCCLGVLCELAVAAGIIGPPVPPPEDDEQAPYVYGDPYDRSIVFLPDKVVEWAGVTRYASLENSVTKGKFTGSALDYFNDKGAPFPLIAEIIEEYL